MFMFFMWFVCAFYTGLVACSKGRSFWLWVWIRCVFVYFGPLLILFAPENRIFPPMIEEYMGKVHGANML